MDTRTDKVDLLYAAAIREAIRAQKENDVDYAASRGRKVANLVIRSLTENHLPPKEPPIFPAKRLATTREWGVRKKCQEPRLVVAEDHPFVVNFLAAFGEILGEIKIEELPDAVSLISPGFTIEYEEIRNYEDYKQSELDRLVGGILMPAIRANIIAPSGLITPFA